jgi:hypothetical protein
MISGTPASRPGGRGSSLQAVAALHEKLQTHARPAVGCPEKTIPRLFLAGVLIPEISKEIFYVGLIVESSFWNE